jgi:hypothetical protein
MRKSPSIILASLSTLIMLLPQSWCCWLVPVDCCQQKVTAAVKTSEQCCCCKDAGDQKPEPAKKGSCPQHGACAKSLRDWAKPTVPSWDDGFNSIAYVLPLDLIIGSDSTNPLDQTTSERTHSPPLHVQNCVWRC